MDESYLVKDHLQDVLLAALYNSIQEAGVLIFKGGTAIRKIYGVDRYSDDLDFNLNRTKLTTAPDAFIRTLRDRSMAQLSPLYAARMYMHKAHGFSYSIDAMLEGIDQGTAKIHIEISDGKTYLPSVEKRILTPDATYFASVMDMNEIIAEKIRAIYTRRDIGNIARDLIDIDFLAATGGRFNLELANEKLNDVNHKPFSLSTFSARIKLVTESRWQSDLGRIMKRVPDREEVIEHVISFVKKK